MHTCEEHEDCVVVYVGDQCPVCRKLGEVEAEVKDAKDELEKIKDKLLRLAD
jgi:hypothetical protein